MILPALIVLPIAGAWAAWISEVVFPKSARVVALLTSLAGIVMTLAVWHIGETSTSLEDWWLLEWRAPWLAHWGVEWHFGLDGMSFVLLALTWVMTALATFSSWSIQDRAGAFHAWILAASAGVIGVLLSLDLFVFFVFWELMLVPLYVMCLKWGGKNKVFATVQFVIFTQVSGLFLLVSTLLWAGVHYIQSGVLTFDYAQLLNTSFDGTWGYGILLGFLVAFLVKLPAFPFHVWLAPLLAESPVGPLLVAIMVKTGAYGLLRFVLPLFSAGLVAWMPWLVAIGVMSIVYGAILAFAQSDPRKVLAYSTLSHMGFVLLGVASQTEFALTGVVILLITQALSTGALLILLSHVAGQVAELDLKKVGGLFKVMPALGVFVLIFTMASIGLPGLGNFIGEWLVLLGIFYASPSIAICAASSIVLGAIYSLWLVQRLLFGPLNGVPSLLDLSRTQIAVFASIAVLLIGIGLYPAPVLDIVAPSWSVGETE